MLSEFFGSLSHELALLGPRYEARRSLHPALASYPSMRSLFAATEPRTEGRKRYVSPEGAAILCALVDLHRETRDRLWGAVLLRAFRPMIRSLSKRLIGGSREDRDALLLASFHEAVLQVDPSRDPMRIAMYVHQATRKLVFRELRKELDWEKVGFGTDADEVADPKTVEEPLLPGVWVRERSVRSEKEQAVAATVGDRGALWRHVRQHYASSSPEEQARVYRRLQKRRSRLVGRLRGRLKGEADPPVASRLRGVLETPEVRPRREATARRLRPRSRP
jgi:hypothetical protein